MTQHRYMPPIAYSTVPSRRKQLMRFVRWLALFMVVMLLALAAAAVIVKLGTIDAQLESAFMQGMAAGQQVCPRGA